MNTPEAKSHIRPGLAVRFLDLLEQMGITLEFDEFTPGLLLPPDNSWVLWYGPEYWITDGIVPLEVFNVVFPFFTADRFISQSGTHRNLFRGLHPNRMERHFAGNHHIPGLFELLEFPETLTVEPWWP